MNDFNSRVILHTRLDGLLKGVPQAEIIPSGLRKKIAAAEDEEKKLWDQVTNLGDPKKKWHDIQERAHRDPSKENLDALRAAGTVGDFYLTSQTQWQAIKRGIALNATRNAALSLEPLEKILELSKPRLKMLQEDLKAAYGVLTDAKAREDALASDPIVPALQNALARLECRIRQVRAGELSVSPQKIIEEFYKPD